MIGISLLRFIKVMKEKSKRRRTVTSSLNEKSTDQLRNRVVVKVGVFRLFYGSPHPSSLYHQQVLSPSSFVSRVKFTDGGWGGGGVGLGAKSYDSEKA
jgi:hypothetical protein